MKIPEDSKNKIIEELAQSMGGEKTNERSIATQLNDLKILLARYHSKLSQEQQRLASQYIGVMKGWCESIQTAEQKSTAELHKFQKERAKHSSVNLEGMDLTKTDRAKELENIDLDGLDLSWIFNDGRNQ